MDLVKEVVIFNDDTIEKIASEANLAANSAQSTFLAECIFPNCSISDPALDWQSKYMVLSLIYTQNHR